MSDGQESQAGVRSDALRDIIVREVGTAMIAAGIAAYEGWLGSARKQAAYNPAAELVSDVYAAMRLAARRSVQGS